MCAFLNIQIESNGAGLSVCNLWHTGKWCGTIKAIGNTDHTRQTWIHMQTPLFTLPGCGPVVEVTSGKVLNWTVCSLNHLHHHHQIGISIITWIIEKCMSDEIEMKMFSMQFIVHNVHVRYSIFPKPVLGWMKVHCLYRILWYPLPGFQHQSRH